MPGGIRVLHCPTNVGGNAQGLAAAERAIGLDSWAVALESNYLRYRVDEQLWSERDGLFKRERKRWALLKRALRDYDVVHFNSGCPILPVWRPGTTGRRSRHGWFKCGLYAMYSRLTDLRDLAWLKKNGVGIVITYQGDDARQGDYCRANFQTTFANEVDANYYDPADDDNKRRVLERIGQLADRICAVNPDLLHVLPEGAKFVPYTSVDPRDWSPSFGSAASRPVVLHAPTHREVKGTRYVEQAVRRLRDEDRIDLEFVLVENMPHADAVKHYRRADLVVDQLLAGWYGGFAVEVMALGKPVVAYIREEDLGLVPAELKRDLPVLRADPQTVYSVLKFWLTEGRERLAEIGARSRAYVERWHDPLRIAGQLKSDYEQILASKKSGMIPSRAISRRAESGNQSVPIAADEE